MRRFLSFDDTYGVDGVPMDFDWFEEVSNKPKSELSEPDISKLLRYQKKLEGLQPIQRRYAKSVHVISKQRVKSLNNTTPHSDKVMMGFPDPFFKRCLSRGYATIRPSTRVDAKLLDARGPFYKDSTTVRFVG